MNDDNGGNNRGMNNNKGEQQVEEEMEEGWERVTKKHKSQMSDDELRTYFDSQLRGVGECPNPATALQSLPIGTSVIQLSGNYVDSMQKRSMNTIQLFSSDLSICLPQEILLQVLQVDFVLPPIYQCRHSSRP